MLKNPLDHRENEIPHKFKPIAKQREKLGVLSAPVPFIIILSILLILSGIPWTDPSTES